MSRKVFQQFAELFAGELALSQNHHQAHTVRNIILSSADIFAQNNPNFSRGKFYQAAGLDWGGEFKQSREISC